MTIVETNHYKVSILKLCNHVSILIGHYKSGLSDDIISDGKFYSGTSINRSTKKSPNSLNDNDEAEQPLIKSVNYNIILTSFRLMVKIHLKR